MKIIQVLYQLIVFFLTVHLIWSLFREKKFWSQVGTAVVLITFLLRLMLVK
ncbi:MAG: hypothetical protein PVF22_00655 [Candidatus Aminicenantes bacterium]|jgi:hypothetical protein